MALGAAAITAAAAPMPNTLLIAPIEVIGDWHAPAFSARAVVTRMRDLSLAEIPLLSDRQPDEILVQNKSFGAPAIWLHSRPARSAWIITDVGARAWCQLAYQFGHELGHVLANSWALDAVLRPPSRWLEEALVESFLLRGLGLLADSWVKDPPAPFPANNTYGSHIRGYRHDIFAKYRGYAREQGATDLTAWFHQNSDALGHQNGLGTLAEAAIPAILGLIEAEPILIADYGGLNRWPARSALPLHEYLATWRASCRQIGAPARLPAVLGELLGLSIV